MKKTIVLFLFLTGCAHVHPATYRGTCPIDFPIKGNLDSLIYHTSDSPYYARTKAEICFENKEAAERNGYRSIREKNWKNSVD
jgi:hypothetical protein